LSLTAISDALVRKGSSVVAHVENLGAEEVKLQNLYCNVEQSALIMLIQEIVTLPFLLHSLETRLYLHVRSFV
jgi:hypothetical protein